jgi:hypothetical protein
MAGRALCLDGFDHIELTPDGAAERITGWDLLVARRHARTAAPLG